MWILTIIFTSQLLGMESVIKLDEYTSKFECIEEMKRIAGDMYTTYAGEKNNFYFKCSLRPVKQV